MSEAPFHVAIVIAVLVPTHRSSPTGTGRRTDKIPASTDRYDV